MAHQSYRKDVPTPPEVLRSTAALTGAAPAGYKFGLNTLTGAQFYVNNAGIWTPYPPSGAIPADFFRSGVGATTLPDGTTDITENIRRNGRVGLNVDATSDLHVFGSLATRLDFFQSSAGTTVVGPSQQGIEIGNAAATHTITLPNASLFNGRIITAKLAGDNQTTTVTVNSQGGGVEAPDGNFGSVQLTPTGFRRAIWQSDGFNWQLITSASVPPLTCPAPMTRVALLALRTSSSLNINCAYVITDHVQGRLVAGTTLTLRAVSSNELSEVVEVNSTYDNEAWYGRYDLDRGILIEVHDNRNNVAIGFNGLEISVFDWGNVNWTKVIVDGATLTTTIGATAALTQLTVRNSANVNLTGFVGTQNRSTYENSANANFTNANGNWGQNIFSAGSINATGYVGGGNQSNNIFRNCVLNFSALGGALALSENNLDGVSASPAGTATFTLDRLHGHATSVLRPATGGPMTLTRNSLSGGSIANNGAATLLMNNSHLGQNASIVNGSIGLLVIAGSRIESGGFVSNLGDGQLSLDRTHVHMTGAVSTSALSTGTMQVGGTTVSGSSRIQKLNGAVATGTIAVLDSQVTAESFVNARSAGVFQLISSTVANTANIDLSSATRGMSIQRATIIENAQVLGTGTGIGTDTLEATTVRGRGTVSFASSGAANRIQYSDATGQTAAINFFGTTGGQQCSQFKALGGSISFTDCPNNHAATRVTAANAGTISYNSATTIKGVIDCSAENGGAIVINESTGGGSIQRVSARAATYNCSGTAASGQFIDVSGGGAYTHNGGQTISLVKAGQGGLTSGAFNHSNIYCTNTVPVVLTASNNSRGRDYFNNSLV